MTADEILRWPQSQTLVLQSGYAPARLPLPDLSHWAKIFPELQSRQDAPPKATKPQPPPIWDLDATLAQSGGGGTQPTRQGTSHGQEDDSWVRI